MLINDKINMENIKNKYKQKNNDIDLINTGTVIFISLYNIILQFI